MELLLLGAAIGWIARLLCDAWVRGIRPPELSIFDDIMSAPKPEPPYAPGYGPGRIPPANPRLKDRG